MIAYPTTTLPKGPLPKPELTVTPNAVNDALQAINAYRAACKQMRANELARIGRDVVVVRLPAGAYHRRGSHKYDDLIR